MWKRALEQRLLPEVLRTVELGGDLLEIGPGPGLTTDFLRRRVKRLTAVEIDPDLAYSLGSRLAGTNVRVVEADATDLPFDSGSFSGAVALTMLHHVPSAALQDRLLKEVCRVLRPGSDFVGVDVAWSIGLWLFHLGDTLVAVDPDTFAARLETAGFRKVAIEKSRRGFRFEGSCSK
jgi:SAM-dependent methyltransferase